jgi:hypothetical protein
LSTALTTSTGSNRRSPPAGCPRPGNSGHSSLDACRGGDRSGRAQVRPPDTPGQGPI